MTHDSIPLRPNAGPPISYGDLREFPEDAIGLMRRLHAEHGDLAVLADGDQRLHFVFSPEYNHAVLSDATRFHSRFFAMRGPRKSAQRRLTSGLLSMNGEEHRRHRRMMMGPFQKRSIETYHGAISDLTAETLAEWKPGEVRDTLKDMTEFMLRMVSAILFGVDAPEFVYRIGRMTDRWVAFNHELGMGAFFPDEDLGRKYEELLDFAERLETELRQMIARRRESGATGPDLLSILIRAAGESGDVDDSQLVGHAALLFAAAHLTTAHALTWTLFLLAQHPQVASELYAEVEGTLQGDGPSLEEIERMPLLDRVIKESMRILPASAYSQRIAQVPVDLGPYQLPQGSIVIFSQFMTHHLGSVYEQPEEFRPERWLGISPSPYEFLPFGAGPRMCLGGPLALLEIKTILPALIKRFRLSTVPGADINGKVISTMLMPLGSIPMEIAAQDGNFQAAPVVGNIHSLVHLPTAAPSAQRRAA